MILLPSWYFNGCIERWKHNKWMKTMRNGTKWKKKKHIQSSIGSVTTGDRLIDGQSRLHANRNRNRHLHRRHHHCYLALLHFLFSSLHLPCHFDDVVIVNLIVQCETKNRYSIMWMSECIRVSIQLVMVSIYWFQLHTSGSNCVQWTHMRLWFRYFGSTIFIYIPFIL